MSFALDNPALYRVLFAREFPELPPAEPSPSGVDERYPPVGGEAFALGRGDRTVPGGRAERQHRPVRRRHGRLGGATRDGEPLVDDVRLPVARAATIRAAAGPAARQGRRYGLRWPRPTRTSPHSCSTGARTGSAFSTWLLGITGNGHRPPTDPTQLARHRVPVPLIKSRLPSGRGSTEQPNVTGDGDTPLNGGSGRRCRPGRGGRRAFRRRLMAHPLWRRHLAFGFREGQFQPAVEQATDPGASCPWWWPGWWAGSRGTWCAIT